MKIFMILRVVFAVIGIVVGVSAFFTFGLTFKNWHCAGWGLASGASNQSFFKAVHCTSGAVAFNTEIGFNTP